MKKMDQSTYENFAQLDIRVGTIITAEDFPKAVRPAFKLQIDFGSEIGILNTSAQITDLYSKESLIGKQVVAVVNFPPKQIANFISQCLVLGAVGDNNKVFLLAADQIVENGLRIL